MATATTTTTTTTTTKYSSNYYTNLPTQKVLNYIINCIKETDPRYPTIKKNNNILQITDYKYFLEEIIFTTIPKIFYCIPLPNILTYNVERLKNILTIFLLKKKKKKKKKLILHAIPQLFEDKCCLIAEYKGIVSILSLYNFNNNFNNNNKMISIEVINSDDSLVVAKDRILAPEIMMLQHLSNIILSQKNIDLSNFIHNNINYTDVFITFMSTYIDRNYNKNNEIFANIINDVLLLNNFGISIQTEENGDKFIMEPNNNTYNNNNNCKQYYFTLYKFEDDKQYFLKGFVIRNIYNYNTILEFYDLKN
jgi:hypothetical protein